MLIKFLIHNLFSFFRFDVKNYGTLRQTVAFYGNYALSQKHIEEGLVRSPCGLYGTFIHFAVFVIRTNSIGVALDNVSVRAFHFKWLHHEFCLHCISEYDVKNVVTAFVGIFVGWDDLDANIFASDYAFDEITEIGFASALVLPSPRAFLYL